MKDFPIQGAVRRATAVVSAAVCTGMGIGYTWAANVKTLARPTPPKIVDVPWRHLPDGRVVIDVRDQQFAFSTTSHDLQNVEFHIEPREARVLLSPAEGRLTLDDVIKKPNLARSVFESATQVAIAAIPGDTFKTNAKTSTPKAPPGKGDFIKLSSILGGGWRTSHIWVNGQNFRYIYQATKCDAPHYIKRTKNDRFGFVVADNPVSPPSIRYCLPATQRTFKTDKDLRIECLRIGGEYICGAWFIGERVAVGYSFQMSKIPEADWNALDGKIRQFYNHIILTDKIQ